MSRVAAIESEGELVQVVFKVIMGNGALMGSGQPAFEQRDYQNGHATGDGRHPLAGDFAPAVRGRRPATRDRRAIRRSARCCPAR